MKRKNVGVYLGQETKMFFSGQCSVLFAIAQKFSKSLLFVNKEARCDRFYENNWSSKILGHRPKWNCTYLARIHTYCT